MPLINCEVSLILTWSINCAVTSRATQNDNPDVDPRHSVCTDHCDNYFVFCLRDFGASTLGPGGIDNGLVDLTDCPRSNRAQTGVLEENNDSLTFTVGQPFNERLNDSVVPNPVQLLGSNWNVSNNIIYVIDKACL